MTTPGPGMPYPENMPDPVDLIWQTQIMAQKSTGRTWVELIIGDVSGTLTQRFRFTPEKVGPFIVPLSTAMVNSAAQAMARSPGLTVPKPGGLILPGHVPPPPPVNGQRHG